VGNKDSGSIFDVAVIGGGAAGLTAAIVAARRGARVVIIEKDRRVGSKILQTGNGRCNLTNTAIVGDSSGAAFYNAPEFVAPILSRYDCEAIRAFFSGLGLMTIADERGWVYPRTKSANSVLDVLVNALEPLKITTRICEEALGLSRRESDDLFVIETSAIAVLRARRTVISTGPSRLHERLKRHRLVPLQPVLGPVRTELAPLKGLDGVRAYARVRLLDGDELVAEETGEVLFRDYGLSGIVVFDMSRHARAGQTLSLDLFPEYSLGELTALLAERLDTLGSRDAVTFLDGLLHRRVSRALLRAAAQPFEKPLASFAVEPLARAAKDFRLSVRSGPRQGQAQAVRGGFRLQDFDPVTLQSRIQPGLFVAGEALDIDAPCGGFNLHWAWASGLTAGAAAAAGEAGAAGAAGAAAAAATAAEAAPAPTPASPLGKGVGEAR
jgi:predicted Rossmann fold flavoprotein